MVSYKCCQFRSGLIFFLIQIHLGGICVYGSKTELSCSGFVYRRGDDEDQVLNKFTDSMLGLFS